MKIEEMKEAIEKKLGVTVAYTDNEKDGITRSCLVIGDDSVRPILYEDMFEYVDDDSVDMFIDEVVVKGIKNATEIQHNAQNISDFNFVKDKLRVCVGHCNDVVAKRAILDTNQYVRIMFNEYSVAVTNEMIHAWNITDDELFKTASKNMTYDIGKLIDRIIAMTGIDEYEDLDDFPEIYIISTNDLLYGASAITDTHTLDKVAEMLNSDVIIVTSSIHEILAFSKDYFDDGLSGMQDLVKMINANFVRDADVLSNNVYSYSRDSKELKIA